MDPNWKKKLRAKMKQNPEHYMTEAPKKPTKEEELASLVSNQQLEIHQLKKENARLVWMREQIYTRLFSVGAPLNDNNLKFNAEQKMFLKDIADLLAGSEITSPFTSDGV